MGIQASTELIHNTSITHLTLHIHPIKFDKGETLSFFKLLVILDEKCQLKGECAYKIGTRNEVQMPYKRKNIGSLLIIYAHTFDEIYLSQSSQ